MVVAALAAVSLGCASGIHVVTDHDPTANFKQYSTYRWHDGTPAKNPLTDQRIKTAIDSQMMAKGFRQVSDSADLTVTYHASTGQQVDVNTMYQNDAWGPYGWGRYGPYGNYWYGRPWGPTYATTTADTVTTGTVVVDMIDNKTKKLVWRGVGSDALNGDPKQLSEAIKKGAVEMFRDFPPKAASS